MSQTRKKKDETYGEMRRRVGQDFSEPTPNINNSVYDRSENNDPDEMRSKARTDLYRANRAVKGRQEDLDYIKEQQRKQRVLDLRNYKRLQKRFGSRSGARR